MSNGSMPATAGDEALQTWGRNLSQAEAAAAEVQAKVAAAERAKQEADEAKAAYRRAMAASAEYADSGLPASPVMRGAVGEVADTARTAETAAQWAGVVDGAATLPTVYQSEHGNDDDRVYEARPNEGQADYGLAASQLG